MTRTQLLRAALVASAIALILVGSRLGALQWLREPVRLKDLLLQMGSVGLLAYLLAYSVLQPVGVPGTAFVAAAGLVWPPEISIPLAIVGTSLATVVGFSFARFVARDWVAARVPRRFHTYDQRLEAHGFSTIFLLRCIFWMNPWLHAVFGLSRVRFSTHLAASVLAYIPLVFGIILVGNQLIGWLGAWSASRWIGAGAAVVVVTALTILVRRRRALSPSPQTPPPHEG